MKKLLSEALGTFGLVFFGTGAIVVDGETSAALGVAGIALVFGLAVCAMIRAFASISGAHLNPAVTIALTAWGRSPWALLLPYIGAQLTGAFLASLAVKAFFPQNQNLGATIPSGEPIISFALEVLLTFLLMLVILACAKRSVAFSCIAIGSVVGLEALLAGPICGASMNPARSIAPAIVSGQPHHLWLYIAAPVLGALMAVWLWRFAGRDRADLSAELPFPADPEQTNARPH